MDQIDMNVAGAPAEVPSLQLASNSRRLSNLSANKEKLCLVFTKRKCENYAPTFPKPTNDTVCHQKAVQDNSLASPVSSDATNPSSIYSDVISSLPSLYPQFISTVDSSAIVPPGFGSITSEPCALEHGVQNRLYTKKDWKIMTQSSLEYLKVHHPGLSLPFPNVPKLYSENKDGSAFLHWEIENGENIMYFQLDMSFGVVGKRFSEWRCVYCTPPTVDRKLEFTFKEAKPGHGYVFRVCAYSFDAKRGDSSAIVRFPSIPSSNIIEPTTCIMMEAPIAKKLKTDNSVPALRAKRSQYGALLYWDNAEISNEFFQFQLELDTGNKGQDPSMEIVYVTDPFLPVLAWKLENIQRGRFYRFQLSTIDYEGRVIATGDPIRIPI